MRLPHKVLLELNSDFLVQIKNSHCLGITELLQNMASGHIKVKKGLAMYGHVFYMATPSHATESIHMSHKAALHVYLIL